MAIFPYFMYLKCPYVGGPKGVILFSIDIDPQGYKLSCCGSFGLVFFSLLFRLPLDMLGVITKIKLL